MANSLYLGDAWGWSHEYFAKIAISDLRNNQIISKVACPKRQLIKNEPFRLILNGLKILGYIPILNILAGGIMLYYAENDPTTRPNNKKAWRIRGAATILTGPLLLLADLGKLVYDLHLAKQYSNTHPGYNLKFNPQHIHTWSPYPGYPVACIGFKKRKGEA